MDELAADLQALVLTLAGALRARGWRLATAESCTGGLIAAACTAVGCGGWGASTGGWNTSGNCTARATSATTAGEGGYGFSLTFSTTGTSIMGAP